MPAWCYSIVGGVLLACFAERGLVPLLWVGCCELHGGDSMGDLVLKGQLPLRWCSRPSGRRCHITGCVVQLLMAYDVELEEGRLIACMIAYDGSQIWMAV